jgi:hypothetical protein
MTIMIEFSPSIFVGILAPFLYKIGEAPRFIRGHAVTLSMAGVAALIYSLMSIYFVQRNKKRQNEDEDGRIAGLSEEEIAKMGDENPRFQFTY